MHWCYVCVEIVLLHQWKSGHWLTVGVCLCLRVCGCVFVGNRPSPSGKRCHSYINKPDRPERHSVGSFFLELSAEGDSSKKERKVRRIKQMGHIKILHIQHVPVE